MSLNIVAALFLAALFLADAITPAASPETHSNATLEIRSIVAAMAMSCGDDDIAAYPSPIIVPQREATRVIRQAGADLSFVAHAEATRHLSVEIRIRDVSRDPPVMLLSSSIASANRASDARLVRHDRRDTVHRLLADGLAAGSAVARSHDERRLVS